MKIGTMLKEVWLDCGEQSPPCKFDKWMRRLNDYGPQWAIDNVETVVGWMSAEAMNRGMSLDPRIAAGLVTRIARRVIDESRGMAASADS